MKKLLSSVALATVMAVSFAQTTDQTPTTVVNPNGSITSIMSANNLSYEDAAAVMAIARATNMDPAIVVTTRGTVTAPFYDLEPAYIIAQQSGKQFIDVYGMYTGGQTWLQIANSLNVSPTYWNPNNVATDSWTNDDFAKYSWAAMMAKNYGMSPDDYTYFTAQTIPFNEIVVAEEVAKENNRPVRDVIVAYNTNKDWPTVWSSTTTTTTTTTTTMPPATPPVTVPPDTTQTKTTTTTSTMPVANEDTVPADHHTQTAEASPIEEWQVNGANVEEFMTGASNEASTTSTFALHRKHHSRHHRSRRHR